MNRYMIRFAPVSVMLVCCLLASVACSTKDEGEDGEGVSLFSAKGESLAACLRAEFLAQGLNEFSGLAAAELENLEFEEGSAGAQALATCQGPR